jgi:hypothetical protein
VKCAEETYAALSIGDVRSVPRRQQTAKAISAPFSDRHNPQQLLNSRRYTEDVKFIGIIIDIASNTKNEWSRIEEVVPHVVCYGCAAPGIHLLLGDICSLQSVADIIQRYYSLIMP